MRPRIGITTGTRSRDPEVNTVPGTTAANVAYAHCIAAAGGLPLLLPNLPEEFDAVEVVTHLNGLLLSGGGDVDPAHWHEPRHPQLGEVDPVRDICEIALVNAALSRGLPTLGICRGVQVMAVATGGDLWQDIPSQCAGAIGHRQEAPPHLPSHDVRVTAESLLARILWPDATDLYALATNSCHHQAVRHPGSVLTPIAWSTDGLIEALVAPDASFFLGVQWHPEEMASVDTQQLALFRALVAATH